VYFCANTRLSCLWGEIHAHYGRFGMKKTSKAIIGALIGAALIFGAASAVATTSHVGAATMVEYAASNPNATAIEYAL
jgi:purine-cytosine permease-like protein